VQSTAFAEKPEDKIEQQQDQDENDVAKRWLQLKGKIKDTAEEVTATRRTKEEVHHGSRR